MLRTLGLYLLDVLVIKTLIILITLPTNLQSQIEIQTLDSYEIQSVDADTLIVTRVSESTDSHLSFLMYRPFCICSDLSFAIFNKETDLKIGDKLQGKMVKGTVMKILEPPKHPKQSNHSTVTSFGY